MSRLVQVSKALFAEGSLSKFSKRLTALQSKGRRQRTTEPTFDPVAKVSGDANETDLAACKTLGIPQPGSRAKKNDAACWFDLHNRSLT